jgi:hypothetical protein
MATNVPQRVGSYQLSNTQAARSAARSRPAKSARGIFATITVAAVVGLLVLRGDVVGGLLAHMASFYRGVVKLGAPSH